MSPASQVMPRDRSHEKRGLTHAAYEAVLKLRRHGHRVTCAKRDSRGIETHHELDGTIVATSWLVDMARASLECRGCGRDDSSLGDWHWVEPGLCSTCASGGAA